MNGLNEINAKLSAHKDELRAIYRVKEIGIFGIAKKSRLYIILIVMRGKRVK